MDDQDDREYSRAPELEDLLNLCKALNAEGVRYVLIGGFAVILHGFVRATKNIRPSGRRFGREHPAIETGHGRIAR